MRSLYIRDSSAAISRNPIWKHEFFDVQGIVKGTGHGRYKNEVTYLFKYLTKCVTGESSEVLRNVRTINEAPDEIRTMLFTLFCNKCFRMREISFGKTFKERIGLIPIEKKESPKVWKRIRTITGSEHRAIMNDRERIAIKRLRKIVLTEEPIQS